MHSKKWELFEWEEELQVLGLEYFYIGKNLSNLKQMLTFFFAALIFLGFGSAISIIIFICEIVCAKNNFANILLCMCITFVQFFNQQQN